MNLCQIVSIRYRRDQTCEVAMATSIAIAKEQSFRESALKDADVMVRRPRTFLRTGTRVYGIG